MATKTLTQKEDFYAQHGCRSLVDYFGILPEKLGNAMLKDLTMIREKQIQLTSKRKEYKTSL